MAPGIIFLLCIIGGAVCFGIGWLTRGEKDKNVYIPENYPHTLKDNPHHIHDHDIVKK